MKTNFILLLAITLLFTATTTLFAKSGSADPSALFAKANAAYTKGDYAQAIRFYHNIAQSGYQNGNLYYNLGNAYFKSGSAGQAILYYEKAKRFIPGDADLKANLSYTLRRVNQNALPWKQRLWETLTSLASLETLSISASIALFLLGGLLTAGILLSGKLAEWHPWMRLTSGLVGLAFLVLLGLTTVTMISHSQNEAIAVNGDGEARFEPNTRATLHFILPEGAKVRVLEQKNQWSLIRRADGAKGWIPSGYVEKI